MPGHISKESWSRCEQPSMLYDSIRNPNAPKLPPKAALLLSPAKDTIETVQQRLNREMLEKFHTKGNHLPHRSIVAVVQVGKFLFLAIMLPPYLCFYGLPKWMLINLLPQIAEIAKQTVVQLGGYFLEFSKWVTDLMRGMIDQTIGYSLRTTKERSRRTWERLCKGAAVTRDAVKDVAEKIGTTISLLKTRIARTLSELYESASTAVIALAKKGYEKAKEAVRTLWDPVTAMSKLAAQNIRLAIREFTGAVFSPMGEAYATANRQVESVKQAIVGVLSKIASPVAEHVASSYRQIKGSVSILLQPVTAWMQEYYERATGVVHRTRKFIEESIKAVGEAVQKAAMAYAPSVIDQVKAVWLFVPNAFRKTGKAASKLLPRAFRNRVESKKEILDKWNNAAKRFASGAANGLKEIAAGAGKAILFGAEGVKRALGLLYRLVRWIFKKLSTFPKYFIKGLHKFMTASGYLLKRLGFTLQIFVAVLWALCIYSSYLVKRTGDRIIKA